MENVHENKPEIHATEPTRDAKTKKRPPTRHVRTLADLPISIYRVRGIVGMQSNAKLDDDDYGAVAFALGGRVIHREFDDMFNGMIVGIITRGSLRGMVTAYVFEDRCNGAQYVKNRRAVFLGEIDEDGRFHDALECYERCERDEDAVKQSKAVAS